MRRGTKKKNERKKEEKKKQNNTNAWLLTKYYVFLIKLKHSSSSSSGIITDPQDVYIPYTPPAYEQVFYLSYIRSHLFHFTIEGDRLLIQQAGYDGPQARLYAYEFFFFFKL